MPEVVIEFQIMMPNHVVVQQTNTITDIESSNSNDKCATISFMTLVICLVIVGALSPIIYVVILSQTS
jgi:hypothetical protein